MHSLHNGLVSVRVFSNVGGKELEITPSSAGYLGQAFPPGSELIMWLMVDQSKADHVVPVLTNRAKTIAVPVPEAMRDGKLVFEYAVPITDQGYVDNENNLVRLIVMTNRGQVTSKNVAIIVQRDEFYLAQAETYKVQVYRGQNRTAVCPDLEDKGDGKGGFAGVLSLIEDHYVSSFDLPPVSRYQRSQGPSQAQLAQLDGENDMIVLSWSLASGVGVGLRKDGMSVKLYWKNVNVADRTPVYLFENEIVTAQGFAKNPDQRSRLRLQAQGITRLEEFVSV